jgi:hypothetical protein
MQLTLSGQLMQFLSVMQGSLFPALEESLGPLTGNDQNTRTVEESPFLPAGWGILQEAHSITFYAVIPRVRI